MSPPSPAPVDDVRTPEYHTLAAAQARFKSLYDASQAKSTEAALKQIAVKATFAEARRLRAAFTQDCSDATRQLWEQKMLEAKSLGAEAVALSGEAVALYDELMEASEHITVLTDAAIIAAWA